MCDDKQKLLDRIAALEQEVKYLTEENTQLTEKLNSYSWKESNRINDSWREIHDMGSL